MVALGASALLAGSLLVAPAHAATGPSQYVEGTDEAAWLYDPLNINRIDLTIPQESLLALSQDTFMNQVSWEPASMVFSSYKGTLPSMNVGMHLKGGLGSRKPIASCDSGNGCAVLTNSKPALKIKLDYGDANANQRLYGLKEITLNSMVQDQSMVHETVDYRLARAAGLPAPRTGFVHVYANGVDLGLHLLVEQYDSTLYNRWFNAGTQSAYEGAYFQDIVSTGNAAVQPYTSLQMHMGTNQNNADLAPVAHAQDTSGATWWNTMMQNADMGELTRDWAFEHFVQQWDAYSWFIFNNYMVHVDNAGIMTMHPWGMDQTLINNAGDYNVHFLTTTTDVSGRAVGTLFTKCLQYTTCKALYISELAKIGATADSLNLPGFIDQVWAVISNDVLNDPVYFGANASRTMLSAKTFVQNRTHNSDYVAAVTTRRLATMTLKYPDQTVFTANQVLTPTLTRNTTATPTYHLMGSSLNPVCSVDSSTGAITVLSPGYCAVSVTTPQGPLVGSDGKPGFHYGYAIAVVDLGKYPGTVSINEFSLLRYSTPQEVLVTTNSTGTVKVTTSGKCSFEAGQLTATVATGNCVVTVTVSKDATHSKATLTKTIPMGKAVEDTLVLSNEDGWDDTTRLPKNATLLLVTKPSKVSGSCSFTGTTLKATGSTGYCKVYIPSWSTANVEHLAHTFTVALAPSTQSFVQPIAAPVTKKKIGTKSYRLSAFGEITTNFGSLARWDISGNCDFVPDLAAADIEMTGSGICTVTLTSDAAFKVKAIKRVWSFTK